MIPQEIADKHTGRFEYGKSDCVQFVADVVECLTGTRPDMPSYRGKAAADDLLEEADLMARCEYQFDPVAIADAEIGDIVVSSFDEFGQIVGVAQPPIFWIRTDSGPIPVDLSLAIRVFRCRILPSRS